MPKLLRPSVMTTREWYKREQRDPVAWEAVRAQVRTRDANTCVYCGHHARKFMQVNHIGAEDDHRLENLELVCKPCHEVLHMGASSLQGCVSVIDSHADQAQIVRRTRALVRAGAGWAEIETRIQDEFLASAGRMYTQGESVELANELLAEVAPGSFRAYLRAGLAVVFHETGPWQSFPERAHRWGILTPPPRPQAWDGAFPPA
jgi:HNH endonuclease